MKFQTATITMSAFLASTILALPAPSPSTQQVSDLNIVAPSAELVALFDALPKAPTSPAGNTPATIKARGELVARDDVFLTITSDANWGGRRETLTSRRGQCYNLQNGWNDQVSAAGPNTGTTCCLWENNNCSGSVLCGLVYPGVANLHAHGWGDRASSYKCT